MAITRCEMRRNDGAASGNRKRSSSRIVISIAIVAALAGGGWFAAPILQGVLSKAAALTDVLLTKVMWSLWVGGSIASGDHSSFVSEKGIDERLFLRVSVEGFNGCDRPPASRPVTTSI